MVIPADHFLRPPNTAARALLLREDETIVVLYGHLGRRTVFRRMHHRQRRRRRLQQDLPGLLPVVAALTTATPFVITVPRTGTKEVLLDVALESQVETLATDLQQRILVNLETTRPSLSERLSSLAPNLLLSARPTTRPASR